MSAVHWRKSSQSGGDGGQCVEVGGLDPSIAVRDSKNPNGPKLIFNATDWHAFTHDIKAGQHDLT
jgi:hypothetical protein